MTEHKQPQFGWGIRFSLRSLIVLTALVGAFYGGRASLEPTMRENRDRIAEAETRAKHFQAALQVSTEHALVLESELNRAKSELEWATLLLPRKNNGSVLLNSREAWQQFRQ